MCVTSRSLVSRLLPLLLGIHIRLQLRPTTAVLQGFKPPLLIGVGNGLIYSPKWDNSLNRIVGLRLKEYHSLLMKSKRAILHSFLDNLKSANIVTLSSSDPHFKLCHYSTHDAPSMHVSVCTGAYVCGAHVKATHIQQPRFENWVWEAMIKYFQPSHVRNFEELGFKVAPSFIGYTHPFTTPTHDGGFARFQTSASYRSWKRVDLFS